MAKIKDLEANRWRTAEELAEALGISVYRRLDKGRLESVETPDGMRYRNCHFTDVSNNNDIVTDDNHSILHLGTTSPENV